MGFVRADELKPGQFIKIGSDTFTVRYCYYRHKNREIAFDLEKGKQILSPYIDRTSERVVYGFDDIIMTID